MVDDAALVRDLRKGSQAIRRMSTNGSSSVSLLEVSELFNWSDSKLRFIVENLLPKARTIPELRGWNFVPRIQFRPKLHQRGVHMFVDADGISSTETQRLMSLLGIDAALSTHFTVRQPGTSQHSPHDIVASYFIPSYMVIDKQLRLLRDSMPVVLKDVVVLCSDEKVALYCSVLQTVTFPDAKVLVCSPNNFAKVHDPEEN